MDNTQDTVDPGDYMETCVQYARDILEFQTPKVIDKKFDFGPHIQEMNTELFLAGVMWRFGEQFEFPTTARDRAFICLMYYYISNGMSEKEAKNRMRELNALSRDNNGDDTLPISIGYEVGDKEGALAELLEQSRDIPAVSGSAHRMLNSFKIAAAVLSIASFLISLILDRSVLESLGIGIIIGAAILLIGSKLYYQLTEK